MAKFIFWSSVFALFYTYAGYPLIITFMAKYFGKRNKRADFEPSITIAISAYNEESTIRKKIENLLSLDYPPEKKEILIGSDRSTDSTDLIINEFAARKVRYFRSPSRSGKPHMLNLLVANAQGEIIVFTDARQMFDNNALRELMRNFSDKHVGCVSGELILTGPAGTEGLGLYWRYEKYLRRKESIFRSMLGATGAIYAIRKELFSPVPENILLDDMYIPLQAAAKGYRAVFDDAAKAYDSLSSEMPKETARKIRTLAGNWQLFFKLPGLLNPFSSRVAFQLFSHKIMRVLAPYFFISAFLANAALADRLFYGITMTVQVLWYLLAFMGYLKHEIWHIRIINIPYIFCGLNIAAVLGLHSYITGKQSVAWKY